MKARLLLVTTLMLIGAGRIHAQDMAVPMPAVISTSTCSAYSQVTCTSGDALACADTLQLATDTRDQLGALLQLGSTWRFPVHIHVLTPDDPLTAKINREASAVFAQGNSLRVEIVVPASDPNAREYVQRQFVTALLWEKFFKPDAKFDRTTRLDIVPIWLVEGLREWLNEDSEHNRESIVKHAVQNKMAPTLAEISTWRELSSDRLLGLWQRAFSFYLLDSLIKPGERRDDFQAWLREASSGTRSLHFPTETAWQRELDDATKRSHALVYTWSETDAELTDAETIKFAQSKDSKIESCTLDTAVNLPRTPALVEALKQRVFVLTELQLRAHPGWQAILEAYRIALMSMVNDQPPAETKKKFTYAHKLRLAEQAYHQKMVDYVNWFEVTKEFSGTATQFPTYFTTAREMERIQADPAHPNPIRANLLLIESEL